jgi:hypothetical protein
VDEFDEDDVYNVAGPAYRYQWGDDERDVVYQVEGSDGPGVQFEWRDHIPENVGWYAFTHPDDEDSDGPYTEAEALDWLWRHPPRLYVPEVTRG